MNNKRLGNSFESELCQILHAHGWWCHNFASKSAGQPVDIIACKNDYPIIIDAKVCINDRFPLSRIEENQQNSTMMYDKCGNHGSYIALKLSNGSIYFLSGLTLIMLKQNGEKSLNKEQIIGYGVNLDVWLEVH